MTLRRARLTPDDFGSERHLTQAPRRRDGARDRGRFKLHRFRNHRIVVLITRGGQQYLPTSAGIRQRENRRTANDGAARS